MSGYDRPEPTGGGYPPPGSQTDCSTLSFTTHLNSPDPSVLKTLQVGDILTLASRAHEKGQIVLALDTQGKVAGTITATLLRMLVDCMAAGYTFEAHVVRVQGGVCQVTVRPGGP